LKVIHSSLKPEEIVEPAKTPAPKKRIVDFPEGLPFSREETASFRSVHRSVRNDKTFFTWIEGP
jgi:hypothetical protein